MKQFVLSVPDKRLKFFLELFRAFKGVKISTTKEISLSAEHIEFVEDLKQSLREVELHEQGKIKLQTAREFLNEL